MQRSTHIPHHKHKNLFCLLPQFLRCTSVLFSFFKPGILITFNKTWSWRYHILPYSGLSCTSPTQNVGLPTNVFEQEPVISGVWLFCEPCRSKFLLYLYILPSHFQGSFFPLFFLIAELHFFLLFAMVKDYLMGFFKPLSFFPPFWGRH